MRNEHLSISCQTCIHELNFVPVLFSVFSNDNSVYKLANISWLTTQYTSGAGRERISVHQISYRYTWIHFCSVVSLPESSFNDNDVYKFANMS